MSSNVANNQHLQLTRQFILHIFPAQKLRLTSHFRKIFLAQHCLKRIMSQLLDHTKKLTKNREKIISGSKLSAPNNEPTFRIHQKMTKSIKKSIKIFLAQNCLKRITSQKNDKKSRKKMEKLLTYNCLKRKMNQVL